MFDDRIGKMMYGDAYENVKKIKRIEENGGYNVYYNVSKNGLIEYDLDLAKEAMEKMIRTKFDRVVFNVLVNREGKINAFLRKYDYNKVAITENAKCTIVLMAVFKEVVECEGGKPMMELGDMLDAFTCRRESKVANGRYVDFTELNCYLKYLAEKSTNDEFYNACMDYIMNVILMYGL